MEWFVDLLRFLYPDADEIFDLSRGATSMDKELLEIMPERNRKGGTLLADMLMKVYLWDITDKGQIMRFIRFLNNLIHLTDKELNNNFVYIVEQITKGETAMNYDELMDLAEREWMKAEVADVSLDFVQKIRATLGENK